MGLTSLAPYLFGIHAIIVSIQCTSTSTPITSTPASTVSGTQTNTGSSTTLTTTPPSITTIATTITTDKTTTSTTTIAQASTTTTVISTLPAITDSSTASGSTLSTTQNSATQTNSITTNQDSLNNITSTNNQVNITTTSQNSVENGTGSSVSPDSSTVTSTPHASTTETVTSDTVPRTSSTQSTPVFVTTGSGNSNATDVGTVGPTSLSKPPATSAGTKSTATQMPDVTTNPEKTTIDDKINNKNRGCETCQSKMFNEDGLVAFIVVSIVCLLLMLIVLLMIIKLTGRRRDRQRYENDERNTPKLQMLEIRDTGITSPDEARPGPNDDGQKTYSLDYDYEKHVRDRIEEHKRKTKTQPSGEPVSTFMIGKKPSLLSSSSSTRSNSIPNSPSSPDEHTPLKSDGDEDPNVFNFSRKPGQSLVARRASNFEGKDRKKSNASTGKGGKLMLSKEEEYHTEFTNL